VNAAEIEEATSRCRIARRGQPSAAGKTRRGGEGRGSRPIRPQGGWASNSRALWPPPPTWTSISSGRGGRQGLGSGATSANSRDHASRQGLT